MRRGRWRWLVVLVALLAACGDPASGTTSSSSLTPPSSDVRVTEPSVPASTLATLVESTPVGLDAIEPGDVPDAAVFLAAVDLGLSGTAYEGDAFEDPETYLGTGVLFCQLLGGGLSHQEVLTAYLLAMTEATGGTQLSDDDLLLGGVILGAGIESLCPEFAESLEVGS